MPRLRAEGAGDMIAHVQVTVPTALSNDERATLEDLRDGCPDNAEVHVESDAHGDGFFSRMRDKFRR